VKRRQLVAIEEFLRPRVVGVFRAGVSPALPDFRPGGLQHRLVGRVLPLHQVLDDLEQPLAFLLLLLLGWEKIGMGRRVVHHLGEDDRPRGGQRP
jgi:hypothetical protein